MALLVTSLVGRCSAADERRFTVADDIGISYFGDPFTGKTEAFAFSPNSVYFVVHTLRGELDINRPRSTIRFFRSSDVSDFLSHPKLIVVPKPLWVFSRSSFKDGPTISKIRWLSNSTGIAFLAKGTNGNDQLWLADLRTKKIHALSRPSEHITAFDVRDAKNFVYSKQSPIIRRHALKEAKDASIMGTGRTIYELSSSPLSPILATQYYDLSQLWAVVDGRRFQVQDPRRGQPLALYREGQDALSLSPDGKAVATVLPVADVPTAWEHVFSSVSPAAWLKAGFQNLLAFDGRRYTGEYALIDLLNGKINSLTDAPTGTALGWGVPVATTWTRDSRSVVLSDTFLSPDHSQSADNPVPCIAVVDLKEHRNSCIERLRPPGSGYHYIQRVRFSEDIEPHMVVDYYFADASKWSTDYFRLPDGSWKALESRPGWVSNNHPFDLSIREAMNEPPVLVASGKSSSRVIMDPNPQLKGIALADVQLFRWRSRDGRDWEGGLYKPRDLRTGKRYPLVIQTHGFFRILFRPYGIYTTGNAAQELAARGILVLQVPDACPIGNSEEASCNVAGYEAAVAKLAADGLVDPDNVAISGFSRTVYYVMEALTNSSLRLKAASITDGVNWGYLQYLLSSDVLSNGLSREANAIIGAPPFGQGLRQWVSRSPEFKMEKVNAPLQVVALGRSNLVFMWEPYAALRYLKKPVDLIVLPEGTHVLTNPAERLASQGGVLDWFTFWLLGEEDPDRSKADQYVRWRELRKLQANSKPN